MSLKERSARRITTSMMALSGAGLFVVFLLEDVVGRDAAQWSDMPWALILRYEAAMTLGGAIAGFLLSGLFGRRGLRGWPLALLGGVMASTLAGLFGSAVGLIPDILSGGWDQGDLVSIASGLAILPLTLIGHPLLFLLWLLLLILTHVWARRTRSTPVPEA